jgi:predicted RNA binding protein YcfA (HicA-like mRNA interferase family)
MPPLPVLPGLRVVRAMEKAGFEVVRIRGSHHVLRHPDGRGTSVPVHRTRRCESVHCAGSCVTAD